MSLQSACARSRSLTLPLVWALGTLPVAAHARDTAAVTAAASAAANAADAAASHAVVSSNLGQDWAPQPPANAQAPLPAPPPQATPLDAATRDRLMLLRRVESLAGQGRIDEAVALLEAERAKGALDDLLERRLINLYRDAGRNEPLEALLAQRVQRAGKTPELRDLRMLADARFDLGKNAEAIATLQRMIELDPDEPAVLELAAKTLSEHGETQRAVQLLLDGRRRLKRPTEFAQALGALYAQLGKPVEATRELLEVIVQTPPNALLLRGQLLELADHAGEQLPQVVQAADAVAARHPQVKQLGLLLAELRLRTGNEEAAWAAVAPVVHDLDLAPELLQACLAALGDARLPDLDAAQRLRSLTWCERVLRALLDTPALPPGLEPRAYDALNRTYLAILDNEEFQQLPSTRQQATLESAHAMLLRMAKRSPDSPMTNAALLRLAQFYVTSLHRPQQAIELYRRLTVSPNAGREEVQLARVGLGTAYIAAGDTARARDLFTAMGKDMGFMPGQGRAHYYLGMLDFMGSHFKTAQDRLASVALEAASAEYTNDALDLALILAVELMDGGPTLRPQPGSSAGGTEGAAPAAGTPPPPANSPASPASPGSTASAGNTASADAAAAVAHPALAAYGQALYYQATGQPDSMQARLRSVIAQSAGALRARARLDLARGFAREGQLERALSEIDALDQSDPHARVVPAALELRGDLLLKRGDSAGALAAYEGILTQYDDYVFLEGVRDKARSLRPSAAITERPGTPHPKEELP